MILSKDGGRKIQIPALIIYAITVSELLLQHWVKIIFDYETGTQFLTGFLIYSQKKISVMRKKIIAGASAMMLIACLFSTSAWAQQKKVQPIIKSSAPDLVSKGNQIVRKYDNIVAAYFSTNEAAAGTNYRDKAFNYIKTNWQKFGIEQTPEQSIKFLSEKSLPGTHVVHFKQYYNGLPVDDNEFTVSFNSAQKIVGFLNTSIPVKGLSAATPAITKQTAMNKVMAYLQKPQSIHYTSNELMIHIINFKPMLAYKVTIYCDNPGGEWQAFVNASTGEISEIKNAAAEVNGTGSVYDCDPVTTGQSSYGTGNYIDNNDADNVDLNAQEFTVTLQDITYAGGQYTLEGPYAVIKDQESPFTGIYGQSTNYFGYNRTNDAFEAVMGYYHIDKSMRYINTTLGISLMPTQYTGGVQYDPNGLGNAANAHYVSSTGQLAFGSPATSVDAAEDACVILHELGHGIHHWLCGGGGPSQVQGLSEGCGDYWAKSYERGLGYWTPGEWGYDHVFFWGVEPAFPGRSCNTFYTYPGGLPGSVHSAGQMWCSTLMKIWNDIGKTKTDRMFLVGLGMTNSSTNQAQAAAALYQAAVNLGYSNYELCIIYHHFQTSYSTYFTSLVSTPPSSGADIYIQDTPNDTGIEINPDGGPMWVSNDIWVRHTNDGGLIHENPEYTTINPNYIYVRIHGRGCTPVTDATLRVYFSKASTGLQWNTTWNNYYITQFGVPVLAGDEITTTPVSIPTINPGEEIIIGIPWFPPNPADFESEIHHFCLLARIESAQDPMYIAETTDINGNTRNNNNIAWKNVSVFNNDPNDLTGPGVFVRNDNKEQVENEIILTDASAGQQVPLCKKGQIFITLSPELYEIWRAGGAQGEGFRDVGEKGRLQVVDCAKFRLGGLMLKPGESYLVNVLFKPEKNTGDCAFDLIQNEVYDKEKKVVVGGERFEYNLPQREVKEGGGKGDILDVIAGNKENNSSALMASQQMANGLYPNPATDFVNVIIPPGTGNGIITIFNGMGAEVMSVKANANASTQKLNISLLKPGIYFVQVKSSAGIILSKKKLEKL